MIFLTHKVSWATLSWAVKQYLVIMGADSHILLRFTMYQTLCKGITCIVADSSIRVVILSSI